MKVVVAANTLSPIGDGKTFVLKLQGAAPHRADQINAAI
jgi:hypothetical protein